MWLGYVFLFPRRVTELGTDPPARVPERRKYDVEQRREGLPTCAVLFLEATEMGAGGRLLQHKRAELTNQVNFLFFYFI